MRQLVPDIQIGKRYLWTPRAIECVCPVCGSNAGLDQLSNPVRSLVCIVEGKGNILGTVMCKKCRSDMTTAFTWEGWYSISFPGYYGKGLVPYTLLSPLEGEDYNDSAEEEGLLR